MAKMIFRGKTIYIDYRVDGVRYKRTTKLKDTPENRKYVLTVLLPELNYKISKGDLYKKDKKTVEYYGNILLSIKEKTVRTYSALEPYYLRVFKHFENRDIDSITRLEIKTFLNSLNMKASSKSVYRTVLKELFELACDDNVLPYNPALKIDLGKDNKSDVPYYTKEEVNRLQEYSTGLLRCYLFIAFNTGMRPEEILGLQYSDIKDNVISITRVRTRGRIDYPKIKNAYRKLHIPSFVNDEIEILKLNAKSLYLFEDRDDVGKLRYLWRDLKKISNVQHKKISCTRHTFATHMLRDSVVSINELSGLLGHSVQRLH
jgi:integrase